MLNHKKRIFSNSSFANILIQILKIRYITQITLSQTAIDNYSLLIPPIGNPIVSIYFRIQFLISFGIYVR